MLKLDFFDGKLNSLLLTIMGLSTLMLLLFVASGDYVYHNDYALTLRTDEFLEAPHLLATGRPLGAAILNFIHQNVSTSTDIKYIRLLNVFGLFGVALLTFMTLKQVTNDSKFSSALISILCMLLPASILTAGWATQLPPTCLALALTVIGTREILFSVPQLNSYPDLICSPEKNRHEWIEFFFVVKKRRYMIGFLFLIAADSIYPQSAMYALTFCVAAVAFSKSEDMSKSLIITLLVGFALVAALILTAIATRFYFQYAFPLLFTQENYRIDSTLLNKNFISVSADLWLALFSMHNTLGGTLSRLTALSMFVAFAFAIKVLLKRKEDCFASKLAMAGVIVIMWTASIKHPRARRGLD